MYLNLAPPLSAEKANRISNKVLKDMLYYERSEITPAEIRWHRLRRGGYQPPANVASF